MVGALVNVIYHLDRALDPVQRGNSNKLALYLIFRLTLSLFVIIKDYFKTETMYYNPSLEQLKRNLQIHSVLVQSFRVCGLRRQILRPEKRASESERGQDRQVGAGR